MRAAAAVREGMAWIPAGSFLMGSEDFYPEEAPVRRGRGRRVLDRRAPGHRRRVPPLREGDRPRHRRRARARPGRLSRTPTRRCWCPARWCSTPTRGPVALDDFRNWWALRARRAWRRPEGPGSDVYTRASAPGHARRLRGRAGLRGVGRARRCRPRPSGSTRRAAGSRARRYAWGDELVPGRARDGQHLAGRVPVAEPAARRLRRHLAGRRAFPPTATASTT